MELDDRMIGEIADQLGLKGAPGVNPNMIRQFENKSDAELERDILRLKEQLKANNISYQKQAAMLRNLAPMMNSKQKARLQRVIELLQR
ncbi:MAG: hypothetical protein IJP00_03735 [Firmicutes bacterium]|nr:hypothetical protein [Bacillota bacterium]